MPEAIGCEKTKPISETVNVEQMPVDASYTGRQLWRVRDT